MDIKDFIERLDHSTKDIVHVATFCSEDQLRSRKDDTWSILEILEHVYITDRAIYTILSKPSVVISSSAEIIGDEKMKKSVVDHRWHKVKSPEALRPGGNFNDLITFKHAFTAHRDMLKKDIIAGKIQIDNRIHSHPFLGEMTITDWLHFIIHHTQRHTEQIKELIQNREVVHTTGN